jgi:hypothetical protein
MLGSIAVSQEKKEPDLKTTVEFMNRMVEPEHRIISMANQCELEVVNNMVIPFMVPDGTTRNGDHLEFTFTVIKDDSPIERFSLSEIDPTSIKSSGGVSSEFLGQHHPVQPSDLKNPDLTMVTFATRDLSRSIARGGFKDSGKGDGTKVFDEKERGAKLFYVFQSKDRAERFITGFVHAVTLCGGKPSDFPPAHGDK